MLIPDRVYKENRVNWNANYQQPDNLKHGNANWTLPAWNEPSRMWNQSNQSNQMKNSRKVSAKQHYLSVARYVAGQSTNLPSRYIMFRKPVERVFIACTMLIIIRFLVWSHIRQNMLSGYPINLLEIASLEENYSLTLQSYDTIVCKSIYILATTIQYLTDTLSRISLPLNIFLSIFVFVESTCRISWFTLHVISKRFLYLCQTLLIHYDEYLICFTIMTDLLNKTRLLALYVIDALQYIVTIVILIIKFSTLCLSRSLNGNIYILAINETSFFN